MQKSKISQWQEAIDTYEELIEISEDEVKINQWKEAIDTYKDLIEDAQESNSEGSKEISVVEKVKPSKNAPLVSKEIKEKIKQWMTYIPKRDKEYLEERPNASYWYKYRVYIYVPERKDWDFREDESFNGLNKIEQDVQSIINNYPNLDHIDFLVYTDENDWDLLTIYQHRKNNEEVSKENKEDVQDLNQEAGYKLSSNQIQFVRDAIASGLEVDYGYTSKGKYEEQVPCVVIPYIDLLETSAYYKTDVYGKNIIAYAPRGRDYMAKGGQSRKIEVGDMVNVRSINKSGVVMECMDNNTCLVKFPSQQHDGYYNLSDLYLLTNDDEFAHGGSIQNHSNLSRMSALAKMLNYSQSLHKQARGGVMSDESFDSIVKNVSQRYEGKKVPKEYQKEYGKRYSKKESQQVGYKVANKVNSRKLQ